MSTSTPFPRRSPRLVGRYVLHDAFARGGMATIHYARLLGDEGFTRTVAVKHLYPRLSADASFVAMFLEEARLLSRVRHPNVVAPLDILALGNELFIAMEYVHGQPLSFLCGEQAGPIPPRLASAIMTQVLLGLHAVHEATSETGHPLGIVHRDVSPQNILLDTEGIARLIDFGIAKASGRAQTLSTARGLLKGKLGYVAPEQIREQRVDRRTDIYMAGIVLWELLTGQRLFAADNPSALFEVLGAPVTPPTAVVPGLSAALNAVVLCALAPNKEQRFETARAMAAALAQAVPPASTIELGAWVEPIAATELGKRAERIAELETLSLNAATVPPDSATFLTTVRLDAPPDAILRMEAANSAGLTARMTQHLPPPESGPVRTELLKLTAPVEASSLPVASLAVPRPGAEARGGAAPSADAEPEILVPGLARVPPWRRALLGAGVVTALGLAAASTGLLSSAPPGGQSVALPLPMARGTISPPERAPAAAVGAEVPSTTPPVVTLGQPLEPEEPAHAPQAAEEPALAPQAAEEPALAPQAAEEPASGAPKGTQLPVSQRGTRTPARSASRPSEKTLPPDCAVPYEVDARGIKRFKRQCF